MHADEGSPCPELSAIVATMPLLRMEPSQSLTVPDSHGFVVTLVGADPVLWSRALLLRVVHGPGCYRCTICDQVTPLGGELSIGELRDWIARHQRCHVRETPLRDAPIPPHDTQLWRTEWPGRWRDLSLGSDQ